MNLNTLNFVRFMLKKKNIYHVIIGLSLLLFTQVVIPLLHNHHSDRKIEQGINELSTERCIVCSLHIISSDFVLPTIFSVSFIALVFSIAHVKRTAQEVRFAIVTHGRGPPAYFL